MSPPPSVRRWIGKTKAADRIARISAVQAARQLDIGARFAQAQAARAVDAPTGLRKREQQQIDEFLASKAPEPLPPGSATAPSIKTIRAALKTDRAISFKRGDRIVTFNRPHAATTPVHDEGGGRKLRRRERRSPNRNGTLL